MMSFGSPDVYIILYQQKAFIEKYTGGPEHEVQTLVQYVVKISFVFCNLVCRKLAFLAIIILSPGGGGPENMVQTLVPYVL